MNSSSIMTNSKNAQTIEITIFPSLQGSSCGGGGCSCGPDPTQILLRRLEDLKVTFGNRFQVDVMQYTTDEQIQSTMDKLNLALQTSNVDYTVSETNLDTVLTSATPILIVNNEIVSSGNVPEKEMLLKYFEEMA